MTIRWMSAFDDGLHVLSYSKFSVTALAGGYGAVAGPDANSRFAGTKYYKQYPGWLGGASNQGGIGTILPAAAHHARMLVGCAYHADDLPGAVGGNDSYGLIAVYGDGRTSRHVVLGYNTAGRILVYRGGMSGTLISQSADGVVTTGWHTFQLLVVLSDTVGEIYVALDGIEVAMSANTGLDTKNAGTATVLDASGHSAMKTGDNNRFTDLFIATGAGTALLGDYRIKTGIADANGGTQEWTGSAGGSHAALVDEAAPNDDTDYVASSTVGQIELFDTSLDLATDDAVLAIQTAHLVRKDDAGSRSVQARIVSAGDVAEGVTTAPSTGYTALIDVFEVDPDTSAAFTPAAAEAVSVGIELAA